LRQQKAFTNKHKHTNLNNNFGNKYSNKNKGVCVLNRRNGESFEVFWNRGTTQTALGKLNLKLKDESQKQLTKSELRALFLKMPLKK